MVKKTATMTIEKELLVLTKKLKINRSEAAEKGMKQEIALKLKTIDLDVENFKILAADYLIEQKRQDEKIILAGQRLEQQELARLDERKKEAAKITEFVRTHPGLPRGELETEYGHVFPNEVWNKVQQKIPVVAR